MQHISMGTVSCGAWCSPARQHCPDQPAEMRKTSGISAGRDESCFKVCERTGFYCLITLGGRGKTQSICAAGGLVIQGEICSHKEIHILNNLEQPFQHQQKKCGLF